jgi:hypothetical protein
MNKGDPQTSITQQPVRAFWREIAKNVITALVVALFLAIPISKIGQWIVKAVVPKEPLRLETKNIDIKFPAGTNSPRFDTYVKFDPPFITAPHVNAHYTSLNQGIDEGRNFIFGVTAVEITPQGFHLTAMCSYPEANGTVEWLAFGN